MQKVPFTPLMFVTPEGSPVIIIELVKSFLRGGGKWVQLRLKNLDYDAMVSVATGLRALCRDAGSVFIVNDFTWLALDTGADGVHLGQKDMKIEDARQILGPERIIGGTANTLAEMEKMTQAGVDYIGLGPYRFTNSKQSLAPVIGVEGYQRMLKDFRDAGHAVPVYAIGGITSEDLPGLSGTGVNGVAVSGFIATHNDPGMVTRSMINELENITSCF